MSIELKAGDYFRRDMGAERYRAVVEKLIEAGMGRHGGEPVGCEVDQDFFGWGAVSGGLFHSSSTPGQSRHLAGRLLTFEDVFPPEHWDGTGEPQVGQIVSADPGRAKVMLEPDADGWAVVQNAAGQWRRLRLDEMRASPESERAAGIAALGAVLDTAYASGQTSAAKLYDAGVRVVGGDE